MKTNFVKFGSIAERADEYGEYVIEPIEGYDLPFDGSDESERDQRLEELGEWYEHQTGIPFDTIDVTRLLSRGDYLEEYPLTTGGMASDIRDLRRRIRLPDGIDFADCRLYVLYPNRQEDTEEAMAWIGNPPTIQLEVYGETAYIDPADTSLGSPIS